ncbi:MAG: D-alanine--D-alanine ligase [Patescibacteria group bacterium]|nr:D-alanine--D-alanine ligase [Patescibacteria group bacterium]
MVKRKKITVGVIFGGQSGEHEVSLVSANSVINSLDRKKYQVIPIGITKSGHWLMGPDALKFLRTGQGVNFHHESIIPESNQQALVPINKSITRLHKTQKGIYQGKLDVVFPVLHGPYGEDGTIQGLFELSDIPYVGAGVLASACGMDKVIMKALFRQSGIPTPKYIGVIRHDFEKHKSQIIKQIEKRIGYPNFIKPANLGSSVGISKCKNRAGLARGIRQAFKYDRKVIIEEAISGREIECSVMGHNEPIASLPGEVKSNREFYDYQAKYIDGLSEIILPAPLTNRQVKLIRDLAIQAFRSIDCSGLARIDFFLENKTGRILVNEINTMPGFTDISMYPKLWEITGLPYPRLLDKLIELAIFRHREKSLINKSFKPSKNWYV